MFDELWELYDIIWVEYMDTELHNIVLLQQLICLFC